MHIKENKLLQLGLYSNALYVFLLFLFMPDGINFEKILISSFLLFSVIVVFVLCYKNKKALRDIPSTARLVFYALMFWSVLIVLKTVSLNIQDWVTNFGNVYMALAWFTPVVLILGQKIEHWKIVVKAVFFMFYLMLIAFFLLPFYEKITTEWTWLLRPVNFILLIGLFRFSLIKKLLVGLTLMIYTIIAIEKEQRIEFVFLFLVFCFIFLDKIKQVKVKRSALKYILFGFIILLGLVFTYGYENISLLASKVIDFQDSRTFLFIELFNDLSSSEQLWGRGSLGTYYSDFFERTRTYYEIMGRQGWAGDSPVRITTEVGYLQMILKGGFVLFILTAFIMLYASFLALFRSYNKFIKRLGLFILALSILSLISFRPAFTPTFIILWMAIGTVLNKKYRMMNDEEIRKLIKFK